MGNSVSGLSDVTSGSMDSSVDYIKSVYQEIVFQPGTTDDFSKYKLPINYTPSKNGNLISYYKFTPLTKSEKIMIFSHGNGSRAYQYKNYFRWLCHELNTTIIAYDYQGYGFSEGVCSEKNCYEDLESIIEHVKTDYNYSEQNIRLIGYSLGTGVTIDYISKHQWSSPVILIAPYRSIITTVAPFTSGYLDKIDMFISINKIHRVTCPVKIYHGTHDTVIPIDHGKDLYSKLLNPLPPVWVQRGTHTNIFELITPELL